MLQITAIEAENYISFGPLQRFEIKDSGLYLLKGFNLDAAADGSYSVGSGKSTLMSIVEFVLWGDVRERFKKKDGIVNKTVGQNCMAAFEAINPQDGSKWRLARHRKHSVHGDEFQLMCWDEENNCWDSSPTMTTTAATSKAAQDMFGISRELYRRSAMLNRDNIGRFLELNEKERGSLFESLLHAADINRMAKKAKTKHDAAAKKVLAVSAEIAAIVSTNKSLAQSILNERQRIANEKKQAEQKVKDAEAVRAELGAMTIDEIIAIFNEADNFTKEISILIQKREAFATDVEKLNKEFEDVVKKQAPQSAKNLHLDSKLAALDTSSKKSLEANRKSLERSKKLLEEALEEEKLIDLIEGVKCKSCGGDVDPEATEALKNSKRASVQAIRDTAKTVSESAEKELKNYQDDIENIKRTKEDIADVKKEIDKLKKEKNEIIIKLQDIEAKKEELKKEEKVIEDNKKAVLKKLPASVAGLELDSIKEKYNKLDTAVTKAKNELESLSSNSGENGIRAAIKENSAELVNKRKMLSDTEADRDAFAFWKNALDLDNADSVRQYLMETIIPAFNSFVNDNVNRVCEYGTMIIFDTNLEETITVNGEVYDAAEFSTGERTRIDLAINMAIFDMLRMTFGEANVVFMDEIFTNVDEPTTGAFLDLIRDKYAENSAVYIASHQTYVAENMNAKGIISVIKENKFSRIQDGDYNE